MKWFAVSLCVGLVALGCGPVSHSKESFGPSDGEAAGGVAGAGGATGAGGVASAGGAAGALRFRAPTGQKLDIIVEPSDDAHALIDALEGAQKSIHMTMYLLTDNEVISTLLDREHAGVEVKVILNRNFPSSSDSNQRAFDTLSQGGVEVVWAPPQFVYTHEKCIIVDGATAWVMTMNTTYTAPTANREYLVVDTTPGDVAEAEAIFEADFAGRQASPSGDLLVAPVNARAGLLALIGAATQSIDVEAEELSDDQVVSALARARDAGVAVRAVVAGLATPAQQRASATLAQHGVHLVTLATPYVHAKAIVADGRYAYVGSANLSEVSLDHNRELGLIVAVGTEVTKVASTVAADIAAGVAVP